MPARLAGLIALVSLALMGGLASACFVKAAGTVFLGEPRTERAANAHEAGRLMLAPMAVLGALCLFIGLSGPLVLRGVWNAVLLFPLAGLAESDVLTRAVGPLKWVSAGGGALLIVALCLLVIRKALLARKPVSEAGTWDCGYAAPTARMQYTSSSFAAPLTGLFQTALGAHTRKREPNGFFPQEAALETESRDPFRRWIYQPLFRCVDALAMWLRPLQQGRIQIYVLYLTATLLILLVWKLR